MLRYRAGFTLVEVLIAVVMVGMGLVALLGAAGAIVRMNGRGKTATIASYVAQRRLERLRTAAGSTVIPCTAPDFASAPSPIMTDGMQEHWAVTSAPGMGGASARFVTAIVTYRIPSGERSDTVSTLVACGQP